MHVYWLHTAVCNKTNEGVRLENSICWPRIWNICRFDRWWNSYNIEWKRLCVSCPYLSIIEILMLSRGEREPSSHIQYIIRYWKQPSGFENIFFLRLKMLENNHYEVCIFCISSRKTRILIPEEVENIALKLVLFFFSNAMYSNRSY